MNDADQHGLDASHETSMPDQADYALLVQD